MIVVSSIRRPPQLAQPIWIPASRLPADPSSAAGRDECRLPRVWLKINTTTREMHKNVSIALQYLAVSKVCRIRHKHGFEPIPQQTPTFPSKKPESAVKSPIPDLGEFYPRDPPRTWDIHETQRSYLAALDRERGRARESERERVDSVVGFIHSASIHRASEILFLL